MCVYVYMYIYVYVYICLCVYVYIYSFSYIIFHHGLSQETVYSSLCYTVKLQLNTLM